MWCESASVEDDGRTDDRDDIDPPPDSDKVIVSDWFDDYEGSR